MASSEEKVVASPTPNGIDMTGVIDTIEQNIVGQIGDRVESIIEQKLAAALARIADTSAGSKSFSLIAHEAEKTSHRELTASPGEENNSTSGNSHNGGSRSEDQLSIHASDPSVAGSENFRRFLAPSITTSPQEDSRSKCSNHSEDHHLDTNVHDAEQTYWQSKTADYQTEMKLGAEVSSPLAGAVKSFWTTSLGSVLIEQKLKESAIPGNCQFLAVKECNKPIFTSAAPNIRTLDSRFQDAQKTHVATMIHLMKSDQDLREIRKKILKGVTLTEDDVQPISDSLAEGMTLAGETNQRLNQLWRDYYKPSIPPHLKSL